MSRCRIRNAGGIRRGTVYRAPTDTPSWIASSYRYGFPRKSAKIDRRQYSAADTCAPHSSTSLVAQLVAAADLRHHANLYCALATQPVARAARLPVAAGRALARPFDGAAAGNLDARSRHLAPAARRDQPCRALCHGVAHLVSEHAHALHSRQRLAAADADAALPPPRRCAGGDGRQHGALLGGDDVVRRADWRALLSVERQLGAF